MPLSYRHHIALGLARAMLAGPPTIDGLHARAVAALGERHVALMELAQCIAALPVTAWPRTTPEGLADRLLEEDAFDALFAFANHPPRLRRYILRPPRQQPPPLGLHQHDWPHWPTPGDLAQWLGIDTAALDWFTDCPPRRRQWPLQHQHYRCLLQPKRSGGFRLIEAPRPQLKAVQRRLLDGLLALMPTHEAATGFVRGGSVVEHAARHIGQAVLLRFDLQDFFGSIRASRVHALFETLGYPDTTARTLAALCTCRTPEPVLQRLCDDGGLGWPQAIALRDPHLPQGAPTSPALANLCAFSLDLRLQALADSLQARYSRYADDLVISGPPLLAARAAQLAARVGAIALEEGFRLNHRKTHVATQAAQQRVCGIVVNRHPNLPRAEFDRFKAELHRLSLGGPQPGDARDRLRGRIAWAASLNPAKAARLQQLFDRITWAEPATAQPR